MIFLLFLSLVTCATIVEKHYVMDVRTPIISVERALCISKNKTSKPLYIQ